MRAKSPSVLMFRTNANIAGSVPTPCHRGAKTDSHAQILELEARQYRGLNYRAPRARDMLLADPATRMERTARVDAGRSRPQGTRRYHCRGMSAWGRGLDMDDAAANADGDGLCSILRAEFVHDVLDVDFHGLFRDRKALANVPIAVALGNLPQDLDLALGQ